MMSGKEAPLSFGTYSTAHRLPSYGIVKSEGRKGGI